MIWQLASREARLKHGKRLEFPVYSDESLFNAEAARSVVGIPSGARRVIEAVQPFKSGPNWQEHPFALLQELSNIDKHRRLHIGQPTVQRVVVDVEGGFCAAPLTDHVVVVR